MRYENQLLPKKRFHGAATMDTGSSNDEQGIDTETPGQSLPFSLLLAAAGSKGYESEEKTMDGGSPKKTHSTSMNKVDNLTSASSIKTQTKSLSSRTDDSEVGSSKDYANSMDETAHGERGGKSQSQESVPFQKSTEAASQHKSEPGHSTGPSEGQKNVALKAPPTYSKYVPKDSAHERAPRPVHVADTRHEAAVEEPTVSSDSADSLAFPDAQKTKKSSSQSGSRRDKAAMIKMAKSLSTDPLVQLSMFRAMQQQNVDAEQVEKIKLEREKTQMKKRAVKRKTTPVPALPRWGTEQLKAPPVASPHKQAVVQRTNPVPKEFSISSRGSAEAQRSQTYAEPRRGPAVVEVPHSPPPSTQQEAQGNQPPVTQLLAALQALQQPQQQQTFGGGQQEQFTQFGGFGSQINPSMNGSLSNIMIQLALNNLGAQQQTQVQDILQLLTKTSTQSVSQPGGVNTQVMTNSARSSISSTPAMAPKEKFNKEAVHGEDRDVDPPGNPQRQLELKVPCRARGMPVEHNFQTAHFMVPDDVAHGQDLVCSYPACRDSGVKFRFCVYCQVPVARRNFRLRHNHEAEAARGAIGSANVPNTICVASKSAGLSSQDRPWGALQNATQCRPTNDANSMTARRSETALKHHMEEDQRQQKYAGKIQQGVDSYQPGDFVPLTIRISSGGNTPVNEDVARDPEARAFKGKGPSRGDVAKRTDRSSNHARRSNTHSSEKKRQKRDHKKKKHRHKRKSSEMENDDLGDRKPTATNDGGMNAVLSAANPRSTKRKKRRTREKNDSTLVEDSYNMSKIASSEDRGRKSPRKREDWESKGPQKFSNKRLMVWAELLGKRPPSEKDEDMSRWLMKVMATSNLSIPLKEEGEGSTSPSSMTTEEFGSDEDQGLA